MTTSGAGRPELRMRPGAVLRDPLIHFLAIAAVLFMSSLVLGGRSDRDHRIEITEARSAQLARLFQSTWGRPPSRLELDGVIQDYVREEIYYREAVALGLDRNDTVVRQRMRQKLEYLQDDSGTAREPAETELRGFYNRRPQAYGVDVRYSFRQVSIAPGRMERARSASFDRRFLAKITAAPDPSSLSDLKLLPYAMEDADSRAVGTVFGDDFARALAALPAGAWSGPAPSAFGVHYVFLERRAPAAVLPYEQVRTKVRSDFLDARDATRMEAAYQALRARYHVVIAPPGASEAHRK